MATRDEWDWPALAGIAEGAQPPWRQHGLLGDLAREAPSARWARQPRHPPTPCREGYKGRRGLARTRRARRLGTPPAPCREGYKGRPHSHSQGSPRGRSSVTLGCARSRSVALGRARSRSVALGCARPRLSRARSRAVARGCARSHVACAWFRSCARLGPDLLSGCVDCARKLPRSCL